MFIWAFRKLGLIGFVLGLFFLIIAVFGLKNAQIGFVLYNCSLLIDRGFRCRYKQARNPKYQAPNLKQYQNSKFKCSKRGLIGHLTGPAGPKGRALR